MSRFFVLVGLAVSVSLFVLLCGGCPQQPNNPVDVYVNDVNMDDVCTNEYDANWPEEFDDVGPKDGAIRYPACKAACDNLKKLGCLEGRAVDAGDDCYTVCAHAESTHKFDLHPACVATAKDVKAVRACGPIRCEGK